MPVVAAGRSEAPPPCKTGVPISSSRVGVDYLTATKSYFEPFPVKALLSIAVGDYGGWAERSPLPAFRYAEVGPFGAVLAWEPVAASDSFPEGGMVQLPGQWWAAAGEQAPMVLRNLRDLGFKCVRIDAQATLPEESSPAPDELYRLEQGGYVVSKSRRRRFVDGRSAAGAAGEGATWYVGSRQSERMLRCYDKTAESLGEVEGVRWELELKHDTAVEVATRLAAAPPLEWGAIFAAELADFVDFREPTSNANVTRRERLKWWEELLRAAGAARAAASVRPPSLPRTREFVSRLGPTLAMLVEAEGGDVGWLLQLVTEGAQNYRPKHLQALAAAGLLP